MSELVALTRLAIFQSRIFLYCVTGLVLVGMIGIVALGPSPHRGDISAALGIAMYTIVPAAFCSIGMFDFGQQSTQNLVASGCDRWILRMPIDDWKIAIVPVVLKTAYISALWILTVLLERTFGWYQLPIFTGCIVFSAMSIWVTALSWRPFQLARFRFAALLVLIAVGFAALAGIVFATRDTAPQSAIPRWWPVAFMGIIAASLTGYVLSVLTLIRSVRLARTAADGIVPAGGKTAGIGPSSLQKWTLDLNSPAHAIAWFRWSCFRNTLARIMLLAILPMSLLALFVLPFSMGMCITWLVLFAVLADYAVMPTDQDKQGPSMTLPVSFLAHCPLRSSTIVWTGFATTTLVSICVFAIVFVLFALFALWPENRAIWLRFSTGQAEAMGQPEAVFSIGIRTSLAVILAVFTMVRGTALGLWWIGAGGRVWFTILMTAVLGLSSVSLLIYLTSLVRQFENWDELRLELLSLWRYTIPVATILVAAKFLAAIACTFQLRRTVLASRQEIVKVWAVWTLVTVTIAISLSLLVVHPRITLTHIVLFTVGMIPLTRVLVLPIMTHWNRHR